jgi:NodT family efflux transporter outer membrane factor (OMF) lipoprotein
MPARWGELPRSGVVSGEQPVVQWWSVFRDPVLDSLVEEAVRSNLDVKLARARIREARAQRGIVAADYFPNVDVSGSYTRFRRSENVSGTPVTGTGETESTGGSSGSRDLFVAGFDAGWEIDIFGGIRRSVEAADATVAASEENHRDVLVTLLAEVARNYLEVRGNQRRISIAQANIEVQQKTLELTRGRFEAGLGSRLEIAQAEAQLTTTQSQIPRLETSVKQAIHRLSVLLGQQPTALASRLEEGDAIPPAPPEVPVGLPSDLLRRRPDVRQAEWELAAATARIGVATADLFPKFYLTGLAGLRSAEAGDFFDGGSRFWSIGPVIQWPVFDAGRIRANIEVQNARQEQALVVYENTVLQSLEEVENALVAYSKEQMVRRSLIQAVDANNRAMEISSELFSKGLVDFLNVLQAQGALSLSQDLLVQSDQRISTSLVSLFKALGGGWEIEAN